MICLICALLAFGSFTACSEEGTADLKKAGVLKVGVKDDVPGFSFLNRQTNQYEGMEIDLAKRIAREILGDENKVQFTPVTTKTRGLLLHNGDIDMVIATFTITDERKLGYLFSTPYFTDEIGLMVKKGAGIDDLTDLEQRIVGVIEGGTTQDALAQFAEETGLNIHFSKFETFLDIKDALDAERIDAFSVDVSVLRAYEDETCVILPDRFAPQDYGVAVSPQKKGLADTMDYMIQKWLKDGTIEELIQKYNLSLS